jgi:hypothetical protein
MFVIVETFLNPGEPSDALYRVRPVEGQAFPTTMRVQCSRSIRQAFPLGCLFRLPVELVENKTGGKFLREVGNNPWESLPESRVICKLKIPKKSQQLKEFIDWRIQVRTATRFNEA